jgi:predicted branched-subunit amino acid permease
MAVSLFPIMMHQDQPRWKYYLSCHFIAISAWLIMRSNYKKIEKKYRVDYWIGIGTATWTVSIIGTIMGFYLSSFLNNDILIGLAILNPIYFICMMVGAMKTIQITLSVLLGGILGPIFYFFSPEWSILLGGFVAGTIAYLVGEIN